MQFIDLYFEHEGMRGSERHQARTKEVNQIWPRSQCQYKSMYLEVSFPKQIPGRGDHRQQRIL